MKVTLLTKTVNQPLAVEIYANDTLTHTAHFDRAIHTLNLARKWFVEQSPKEEPKKK